MQREAIARWTGIALVALAMGCGIESEGFKRKAPTEDSGVLSGDATTTDSGPSADAAIDGQSTNTDPETACDGTDNDVDGQIDEGACPCNRHTRGNNVYLFCGEEDPVTWESANVACTSRGYDLVTIDDGPENEWVAERAPQFKVFEDTKFEEYWGAWIGLFRKEGTTNALENFEWASGEQPMFFRFRPGEPNNFFDLERCVEINYDKEPPERGLWNDAPCNDQMVDVFKPYVCELDPTK